MEFIAEPGPSMHPAFPRSDLLSRSQPRSTGTVRGDGMDKTYKAKRCRGDGTVKEAVTLRELKMLSLFDLKCHVLSIHNSFLEIDWINTFSIGFSTCLCIGIC